MNNIKQSELNLTLEEFRLKYGIEKWQMFEALMMSEKAYEANRNKPVMKYAVSSPLIRNVIGDKSDKTSLAIQELEVIQAVDKMSELKTTIINTIKANKSKVNMKIVADIVDIVETTVKYDNQENVKLVKVFAKRLSI